MIRQVDTVLKAWRITADVVAGSPTHFLGRDKETKVFRRLRQEIQLLAPDLAISGPDYQTRFNSWGIDLVCSGDECSVAVEGKYKTSRDGAVPDNRKAAFLDLFRLEEYVTSGKYAAGMFLWLTDHSGYRQVAAGGSADFSTHDGRVYKAGTPLWASRARNALPRPLVLRSDYLFRWKAVDAGARWFSLTLSVAGTQPNKALEPSARN
jgi:hypothetical protein